MSRIDTAKAPQPNVAALLHAGSMHGSRFSSTRWDLLVAALPTTVHQLWRRRAGDVPEGFLDDYVTLQWMVWNGGTLQLTDTGRNVLRLLESAEGDSAEAAPVHAC